jgi:hypothetical protein
MASSFNVEISKGLDSLVGDPNDVELLLRKANKSIFRRKK